MASTLSFLEAVTLRRSTITLQKASPIPDSKIIEIVQESVKHAPSPFHVQSARAVVLLHKEHEKLWDIVYEHTKKTAPPPVFNERLGPNLEAYKASYGTVLFFEDTKAVEAMPPFIQTLIKNFPEWAQHSNGMAQYVSM